MKLLLALCVLALVAHQSLGCVYVNGHCSHDCEDGTHEYTRGCGPIDHEPTCDNPNPTRNEDEIICDYSACHCNPPTVRDTDSRKCVTLDKCPKKGQ